MASEEALTRKKKLRTAHRSSTTRLIGQAEALLAEDSPDVDELTLFQTNLATKLATLSSLDAEIAEIIPEEELETDIGRADEYTERLQRIQIKINGALNKKTTPPTVTTPLAPTVPTSVVGVDPPPSTTVATPDRTDGRTEEADHTPIVVTGGESRVRLPKISLPHFKGHPIYWTAFWDAYESAIHNNSSLSNIDKFNYLRSLLEKSAYDAIAGLTLSAANYTEAIEILKRHFGNRQMIVSRHMDILLSLNPVSGEYDNSGLRRLYNDVETNVRSLEALGVERDTYGTMLTSVLLTKLPTEIRLIITRSMSGEDLNLETLMTKWEEELDARERARDPPRNNRSFHNSSRTQPTVTTTLLSGTAGGAPKTCCYCQQAHPAAECTTVTGTEARQHMLKASGRCYNCLGRGHLGRQCRMPPQCPVCKRKHHPSICEKSSSTSASLGTDNHVATTSTRAAHPNTSLNPEAAPYIVTPTTTALCPTRASSVILQTARALVYDPKKPDSTTELRILLDSGSQRSYMTERARRLLHLDPEREQVLQIAAFGSVSGELKVCPIVSVGVLLTGYKNVIMPLFVVPTICEPLRSQPIDVCISQNPHLSGMKLADWADEGTSLTVDILIGLDQYWNLVTGVITRQANGLTAVHTKLGWVLSGPVSVQSQEKHSTNLVTTHILRTDAQPDPLSDQLRAFWELESLGIQLNEKPVSHALEGVIEFREGRYEVPLPWKQFHNPLPDNYGLSQRRLGSLIKRLKQNPTLLRDYDHIIQEQIEKGIVEDATMTSTSRIHYLPHHAVVRSDKDTTKLRIVFDASAKLDGRLSLNDCLHVGPKFNQKILDILLSFRSYKVALTADIEKAFLMVSVRQEDRDVLRFLWVKNIDDAEMTIRPLRFTRVVFGVCCSPYLLNSTIQHHLERYQAQRPELVQKLSDSLYVDDVISGAKTVEEAFKLYAESKSIMKEGGAFNLRKFKSNSQRLQSKINAAEGQVENPDGSQKSCLEETYSDVTLGKPHSLSARMIKVLGVIWDPETDSLHFDMTDIARVAATTEPTKRNIVSIIGRFYDPLGYLSPVVIRYKKLFQRLCSQHLQWDEVVPPTIRSEWDVLVKDLQNSPRLQLPRSYLDVFPGDECSYQLCGFCDASTTAYAAVVYLVVKTRDDVYTRFLVAKTRVAPIQTLTIPRLESYFSRD